jgi:MFS family permease
MRIVPIAYLSSYLLSLLGNSIAAIALPLIVLQVTGSALGAGALAVATMIPAVLAGLFMGVVIDRINRRTSSIVTDLISALSVAALPVVDVVTGLSLGWFVLFGILGSLGDVPGMTAREALLPAIVRNGGISAERRVGLREGLGAVALLVGPALAGILMSIFEGSTVLWITAGTSLAAALITLVIPGRVGRIVADDGSPAPVTSSSSWTQLRDGWRGLVGSPFLMAVTGFSVVFVFVLGAYQGLILPVYYTQLEQPGLLGFVLTALALGLLVGSGIFIVAGARVSRRRWLVVGVVGSTAGFAVIAALPSPWWIFAGAFLVGVFSGLFSSLLGVLMIERIPETLRGRITGTQNAIMTAVGPLAIVLAALLVQFVNVGVAALAIGAVWLIAAVGALLSRSLRSLDSEPLDSEPVDSEPVDSEPVDAEPTNQEVADAQ